MKTRILLLMIFVLAADGQEAHGVIADTLDAMREKVMGKADAPVTIIEYASLTCPHCGHFHNTILPEVKKEFIDTGKVKFIYRDFPLDHVALRASMLARCNSHRDYFGFLKVLYRDQERWITASDPLIALLRIARLAGINGEDFKQCIGNQGLENAILQQRLEGAKEYRLRATPSLIINGDLYEGSLEFGELREAIEDVIPDDG